MAKREKFKWRVRKILAVDLTSIHSIKELNTGTKINCEHISKNNYVAVNKMALRTSLGPSKVPNPIWQKPTVFKWICYERSGAVGFIQSHALLKIPYKIIAAKNQKHVCELQLKTIPA